MNYKNIILLLVSLLINNCIDDTNPVEQEINPEDLSLRQKLIGGWQFAGDYIYFKEDGTYIDSSFVNPNPREPGGPTPNICSNVKKNGLYLNQITEGLFKVENGLLKKQPEKYTLDCNPLNAPGCYLYFDSKIEFRNDTLKLTTDYVWTKSGNNNDIWGNWRRNYWAWSYYSTLPPNGSRQLITESISFFSDSSVYHQKIEGLPYDGSIASRTFNYNPPILSETDAYTFYLVTFKNDEMHWTEKNWSWNYKRIR